MIKNRWLLILASDISYTWMINKFREIINVLLMLINEYSSINTLWKKWICMGETTQNRLSILHCCVCVGGGGRESAPQWSITCPLTDAKPTGTHNFPNVHQSMGLTCRAANNADTCRVKYTFYKQTLDQTFTRVYTHNDTFRPEWTSRIQSRELP